MDSRAKKLIEALGLEWAQNQTPITHEELMERAASEYDKLAEQAQRVVDTNCKATGCGMLFVSDYAKDFRGYASELRAMIPKEPTQEEKDIAILADVASPGTGYVGYDQALARITLALYRDYLKRQGKE